MFDVDVFVDPCAVGIDNDRLYCFIGVLQDVMEISFVRTPS